MIFGSKNKIEEYIIEALDEGPLQGPELIDCVQAKRPQSAREAVYRALRKLMAEEVVSKNRKAYSLSRHWLQRIRRFANRHTQSASRIDADQLLALEDGDRVTYHFKSAEEKIGRAHV